MTTSPQAVAKILLLNGGDIVGKTRLQKSGYFLETDGVGFDFEYDYYHYGPYSEELATSALDAEALGLVGVNWRTALSGIPYAVFSWNRGSLNQEPEDERRREILHTLGRFSSVALELAATADYLSKSGYAENAWDETRKRKSSKATPDNLYMARTLLNNLDRLPRQI